MADQSLAATHPGEVWAALGGAVTLVVALVTVLWKRMNEDIKGHDSKLSNGQKVFQDHGERLIKTEQKIESAGKEDDFLREEIDRIDMDIREIEKRLRSLELDHSRNHAK